MKTPKIIIISPTTRDTAHELFLFFYSSDLVHVGKIIWIGGIRVEHIVSPLKHRTQLRP